jgi:XTP/dITP diphosphohydrolase
MSELELLTVATRNGHKTQEIAEMLKERFVVRDLSGIAEAPEIEETGKTFAENAALKAVGISRVLPGMVLADDSGLEVDVLGGAPGVHSARYAGVQGDDAANNKKLIEARKGRPEAERRGRFRCVLVLAREGEVLAEFSGAVEGHLLEKPRGMVGFGYDPLFVPKGFAETFAELGPEVKNQLSHRARALDGLVQWLEGR